MAILIDGHNLIPKVPGLSLRAMDDEIALIKRLQTYSQQSGKRVEIYFDGAPAGQARTQSYGKVKAHFIRVGRTADDAIKDRLRRLGKTAKNWTVVSSDRQVVTEAKSAGAKVVDAGAFAAQMSGGSGDEEDSGADVNLSEGEVDEWMRLFGEEGGGKGNF